MEYVLAVILLLCAAAVVVGVAMLSPAAGWIIAGILIAGWALVVFRGTQPPDVPVSVADGDQ